MRRGKPLRSMFSYRPSPRPFVGLLRQDKKILLSLVGRGDCPSPTEFGFQIHWGYFWGYQFFFKPWNLGFMRVTRHYVNDSVPPSNPLIFNGFFGFWGSPVRNECSIRSNSVAERTSAPYSKFIAALTVFRVRLPSPLGNHLAPRGYNGFFSLLTLPTVALLKKHHCLGHVA
jgi:hypothetical protein